ncbi:hypothetical protein IR952_004339, partial [Escherichia coli]|nr:hypothetical protein [Escherichia coli]HCN0411942.1 hypothetical protein [Escherichia coli]
RRWGYADTKSKNTAKIQNYIKHPLEVDEMGDKLSILYLGSPLRSVSNKVGYTCQIVCAY